jgi:small subunit ribosomal protein S1
MEELLAESKIELLKEGSVISGTIMEIRPTEVVIDFGGKAEGTIPAHEFLDLGDLEIGSDLEVFLERLEDRDGNPQLSFDKAEQKKNWEKKLLTLVKKDLL